MSFTCPLQSSDGRELNARTFSFGKNLLVKITRYIFIKNLLRNNDASQLESPLPEAVNRGANSAFSFRRKDGARASSVLGTSARLIGVRVRWSDLFKDAHGGLWDIARHCQICAALANPVRRVREALKAL